MERTRLEEIKRLEEFKSCQREYFVDRQFVYDLAFIKSQSDESNRYLMSILSYLDCGRIEALNEERLLLTNRAIQNNLYTYLLVNVSDDDYVEALAFYNWKLERENRGNK